MSNQDSATDAKFPLQDFNEICYAHHRYLLAFESAEDIEYRIPPTTLAQVSPDGEWMIPMIIEAPLNSVEVFEAILKPEQPYQIHKARHVPRGRATKSRAPGDLLENQQLYDEYSQFQGRLEQEDREFSFICIPFLSLIRIRRAFGLWPVCLHYISISWGHPQKGLYHPWAIVLHERPGHGLGSSYEEILRHVLIWLEIPDCRFERSLLAPGTVPVPECVMDWILGVAGTSGALPYYAQKGGEEEVKEVFEDGGCLSKDGDATYWPLSRV